MTLKMPQPHPAANSLSLPGEWVGGCPSGPPLGGLSSRDEGPRSVMFSRLHSEVIRPWASHPFAEVSSEIISQFVSYFFCRTHVIYHLCVNR